MKKHQTGKWKYGSVSALMIVMVLAALIALNAGVYALEKKKGWRIDLSFNGITSQSRETEKVLKQLQDPVQIWALFRATGSHGSRSIRRLIRRCSNALRQTARHREATT